MGLIEKIFSGSAGELIKTVGETIDKFVTTSAEKEQLKIELQRMLQEHELKMAEQANMELGSYLADTQGSRDASVRIQESDKSSYLSKNIAYWLDLSFCILFAIMLFMIFKKEIPVSNKELFYTGFGLLGGIITQIVSFHRGSSKSSEKSGDVLRRIAEK